MSDEATIAASTLLSSLLTPIQPQPMSHNGVLTSATQNEIKRNPGAFEDVLSDNYDAAIDFRNTSANQAGFASPLAQGSSLALATTGTLPTAFSQAVEHSLGASGSAIPVYSGSGNILPETGADLPLAVNDPLSPPLHGETNLWKSDAVHNLTATGSGESQATGAISSDASGEPGSLEESQQWLDQPVTNNPAAGHTAPTSPQPADTTPVLAGNETSTARSGEISGSVSGNTTPVQQGAPIDAQLGAEGDPEQNQPSQKGIPEQLELSGGRPEDGAEFSQNNEGLDERLSNAAKLTTRPGEPTSHIQGTATGSIQLLGTPNGTTIASLPLAADKAVAGAQIAQTLSGFIRHGDDQAEINLTPPHLGKISVRIALQNDQVNLVVSSPMPEVREAIEASLPRLGELLSEAGLSLGDTNVANQENFAATQHAKEQPELDRSSAEADSNTLPTDRPVNQIHLLDAYA